MSRIGVNGKVAATGVARAASRVSDNGDTGVRGARWGGEGTPVCSLHQLVALRVTSRQGSSCDIYCNTMYIILSYTWPVFAFKLELPLTSDLMLIDNPILTCQDIRQMSDQFIFSNNVHSLENNWLFICVTNVFCRKFVFVEIGRGKSSIKSLKSIRSWQLITNK